MYFWNSEITIKIGQYLRKLCLNEKSPVFDSLCISANIVFFETLDRIMLTKSKETSPISLSLLFLLLTMTVTLISMNSEFGLTGLPVVQQVRACTCSPAGLFIGYFVARKSCRCTTSARTLRLTFLKCTCFTETKNNKAKQIDALQYRDYNRSDWEGYEIIQDDVASWTDSWIWRTCYLRPSVIVWIEANNYSQIIHLLCLSSETRCVTKRLTT